MTVESIPKKEIEELDEIEDNDNVELDDIDKIQVKKKPNIYQNEQAYTFNEKQERIDVFIKNYLMKFDMEKSLKVFEQEFYENLSKGEIDLSTIGNVPEVYIKSEEIQTQIGNFQKDLDSAKIYAEKANSKFLKLHRAKEDEKIRHRRVQQEKQKLIKQIDKMKKIYEKDNAIYKDLLKKYGDVTVKTAIFDTHIVSMKQKLENLDEQLNKLRKTLSESKKEKEQTEIKDKSLIKEELKGNKIINWTPFPIPPKDVQLPANVNPANLRMNVFKSFPGHLSAVTAIDFHPKKSHHRHGQRRQNLEALEIPHRRAPHARRRPQRLGVQHQLPPRRNSALDLRRGRHHQNLEHHRRKMCPDHHRPRRAGLENQVSLAGRLHAHVFDGPHRALVRLAQF
jgi:hypothetical protein